MVSEYLEKFQNKSLVQLEIFDKSHHPSETLFLVKCLQDNLINSVNHK